MIFVSYRHADSGDVVAHLDTRLKAQFGSEQVFVDKRRIKGGQIWRDEIQSALGQARVLLAIVGEAWGTEVEPRGEYHNLPRLWNPKDWVRREICTAVRSQKESPDHTAVIVVLLNEARLPETHWHCELDELGKFQHVRFRSEHDFDAHFETLCSLIEEAVPGVRRRGGTVQSARSAPTGGLSPEDLDAAVRQYVTVEKGRCARMHLPLQTASGVRPPIDIDRFRIDVPLDLTYRREVSARVPDDPEFTPRDLLQQYVNSRDTFTDALQTERLHRDPSHGKPAANILDYVTAGGRLAVVGPPGSGKSTLLQWLGHTHARDFLAGETPRLPILILCREYAGGAPPAHLSELLVAHLRKRQFSARVAEALAGHFTERLDRGEALLLIDGLDEIPEIQNRRAFAGLVATVGERFSEASILVSSRPVGFHAVSGQLAGGYDHALVTTLEDAEKRRYIAEWVRRYDGVDEATLLRAVEDRSLALLTSTALMLATVIQIQAHDEALPLRRVEVYRRAARLMIQRHRPADGPPLTPNEVIPHLERLAFHLRNKRVQRCSDLEAISVFEKTRDAEPAESTLRQRSPSDLLRVCVESMGLLNIVGVAEDDSGFERDQIQFSHQSFQEYFAGQAIKHARDGSGGETVSERFQSVFEPVEVVERAVPLFKKEAVQETVIAEYWQEAFRLLIADLRQPEADAVLLQILPDDQTPPAEARPRAVLALLCIADEPVLSADTLDLVVDVSVTHLMLEDAWGSKSLTSMDEALGAAARSKYGAGIAVRLVEQYILSAGMRRLSAGRALLMGRSAEPAFSATDAVSVDRALEIFMGDAAAGSEVKRVESLLYFMEDCFLNGGKLGFFTPAQQQRAVDWLMRSIRDGSGAERSAATWAMNWLTGCRVKDQDGAQFIHIDHESARVIEAIARAPESDPVDRLLGMEILMREEGVSPAFGQSDWVYTLAVVADGGQPRRGLILPELAPPPPSREWVVAALESATPGIFGQRIARVMGAMGIGVGAMVEPLAERLHSGMGTDDERSEAMFYLGLIGTPAAAEALIEAADADPEGGGSEEASANNDFLYARGLFGLLLLDDVDVLASQILKNLPHSDLRAYAYGLAGSRDPRGREVLHQLRDHPEPRIQDAVAAALMKPWESH